MTTHCTVHSDGADKLVVLPKEIHEPESQASVRMILTNDNGSHDDNT
jgi:hypothetical protein